MSNYEKWLESDLTFRRRTLLNHINEIENILKSLRGRIDADSYLNDLGELQQNGVMLDTAIAAYATERQALKNYREMGKGREIMAWEADETPGFSSVRISREILNPYGIYYNIRYGSGTIEVELTNTKESRFAHDVAEDMRSQGISTEIIETEPGFIIRRTTESYK